MPKTKTSDKNISLFKSEMFCLFAVPSLHCEVRGALFYTDLYFKTQNNRNKELLDVH